MGRFVADDFQDCFSQLCPSSCFEDVGWLFCSTNKRNNISIKNVFTLFRLTPKCQVTMFKNRFSFTNTRAVSPRFKQMLITWTNCYLHIQLSTAKSCQSFFFSSFVENIFHELSRLNIFNKSLTTKSFFLTLSDDNFRDEICETLSDCYVKEAAG